MSNTIDLSKLTPAQLEELERQMAEVKARQKAEIESYKNLVSEAVNEAFPVLEAQSRSLAQAKTDIYEMFKTAQELKGQLFQTKRETQWSHTFINADSTRRITLGFHTLDNYDDTAEDGIAMVNEYLDSLAEGSEQADQAVKICRSLMAKDRKGNLKPAKIITLRKHALESGSPKFIEGVDIILAAYKPVASKQYVRAEYKNERGEWVNVPLGMTEA